MPSHTQSAARRAVVLLFLSPVAPVLADGPVPYSDASVAEGAALFQRYCTECHGRDGRAQVDVISDATNLTEPDEYYSGASSLAMYDSSSGGAGGARPALAPQREDTAESGHRGNVIRSLWTPAQRDSY